MEEDFDLLFNHLLIMKQNRTYNNRECLLEAFKLFMGFMVIAVKRNIISLFDFGEMQKVTYTFGSMSSRPRPNWTYYLKSIINHLVVKPKKSKDEKDREQVLKNISNGKNPQKRTLAKHNITEDEIRIAKSKFTGVSNGRRLQS